MAQRKLHYRPQDLLIVTFALVVLMVGLAFGWWLPLVAVLVGLLIVSLVYTDPLGKLAREWVRLSRRHDSMQRTLSVVWSKAFGAMKSVADFWSPTEMSSDISLLKKEGRIYVTTPERRKWVNPFDAFYEMFQAANLSSQQLDGEFSTSAQKLKTSALWLMRHKTVFIGSSHEVIKDFEDMDALKKHVFCVVDYLEGNGTDVRLLRGNMERCLMSRPSTHVRASSIGSSDGVFTSPNRTSERMNSRNDGTDEYTIGPSSILEGEGDYLRSAKQFPRLDF